jgi:muramoyltetrapeptide carboxypeptidase
VTAALRPPRLRAGARVALVSPAGPITEERLACALAQCETLGIEPVVARSALRRHGYLAGPDDERAADFQQAVADPSIDAIWALRGGYGTMRLLGTLDLTPLLRRPKAFVGFSDNTALHLALGRAGLASFHGSHAGGAFPTFTECCFRSVLFQPAPAGRLPLPPPASRMATIVGGTAEGALIGGNLSMLAAASGTPFGLEARGRILVIEDVGEATYRVDRALMQLKLAGGLEGIAGIVLGQFTEHQSKEQDFPLAPMLAEMTAALGAPCVAGAPVGHVDDNWCIPLGVRARLDADAGTLDIIEPAVT